MAEEKAGGAAFARPLGAGVGKFSPSQTGMTLRDYFAAKALQGMLADSAYNKDDDETLAEFREGAAAAAYAYADAMIQARK